MYIVMCPRVQGAVLECRLGAGRVSALLEVLYPPQFTLSRRPQFGTRVTRGSTVTLSCAVDSSPASRAVFWQHHGHTVSNTSSLELEAVTAAQAGWYQCLANHKLGNYSSVGYFLTVVEADATEQEAEVKDNIPPCAPAPAPVTVVTPQHNVSTSRGQNVTLYAKYCAAAAPLAVVWAGPGLVVRQGEAAARARTNTEEEAGSCATVSLAIAGVQPEDGEDLDIYISRYLHYLHSVSAGGLYVLLVSTEAGAGQGRAWLDVAPGGEKVVASSGSNCDNSALVKLILTILMVSWLP